MDPLQILSPDQIGYLLTRFTEELADVSYPGYTLYVRVSRTGAIYLQATYTEEDAVNGTDSIQMTRRWLLSPHMTHSEVVSTAFLCILTSMEHRVREWFRYKGHAIYMPHYSVDDLVDICAVRDTRTATRPQEA